MSFNFESTVEGLVDIRPCLHDSALFLKEAIRSVCEAADPVALFLIGSVASNTQDTYSDVDICLVTDIVMDETSKNDILNSLRILKTVSFVNYTDLLCWMPNLFSIHPKSRSTVLLDISVCTKTNLDDTFKYCESHLQLWPVFRDTKERNRFTINTLTEQGVLAERLENIPYETMHTYRKLVKAHQRKQFNFAIFQLERLRNICAELILFSKHGNAISKDMFYRPLKYIADEDLKAFLYWTTSYNSLLRDEVIRSVAEELFGFIKASSMLSDNPIWSSANIDWWW